MLAKNLKISAPIIFTKLIGSSRLAILVDKKDSCLVRIIDSVIQKPLSSYKLEHPTQYFEREPLEIDRTVPEVNSLTFDDLNKK